MLFEAHSTAGTIKIKRDGKVNEFSISTFDLPSYDRYREIAQRASGDDVNQSTEAMLDQIKFLVPDLELSDLIGIPVNQLKAMIEYALKCAIGENFTELEKKSSSGGRSRR